jgi:hypothetical protein
MNWFNINRNIPIHGVTNNFSRSYPTDITAWGNSDWGGTGAPSDNGYTKIYSAWYAFAALKADLQTPNSPTP